MVKKQKKVTYIYSMDDLNKKLRLLKNEDLIWIIYIFIAIAAIVSNYFERKYDLTNNRTAYKNFKTINICIFTVAFFIYLYFLITIYDKLKSVRESIEKFRLTQAQLFGAILFLVGGLIYLIVEISENEDIDVAII